MHSDFLLGTLATRSQNRGSSSDSLQKVRFSNLAVVVLAGGVTLMKALLVTLAVFSGTLASAAESQVTVHLLDHTGRKKTEARFWIDWSKNWRGVVASKVVTGKAADELILHMRQSLLNKEAGHFCGHDPIYGIEAIGADGKKLKTSLCFSCLTWVKPGLRLNIAGERGANNALCRKLREVIELPDELLKPASPTVPRPTRPQAGS